MFRVLAKSQKMRTQICETVKSWLLKIRAESSGGWWGKWVILVGLMGDWEVPGEEPKRRQRLRARWCRRVKKYSIFI